MSVAFSFCAMPLVWTNMKHRFGAEFHCQSFLFVFLNRPASHIQVTRMLVMCSREHHFQFDKSFVRNISPSKGGLSSVFSSEITYTPDLRIRQSINNEHRYDTLLDCGEKSCRFRSASRVVVAGKDESTKSFKLWGDTGSTRWPFQCREEFLAATSQKAAQPHESCFFPRTVLHTRSGQFHQC